MMFNTFIYVSLFVGCAARNQKTEIHQKTEAPSIDANQLIGSWSETWGCNNEETDVTYSDVYDITFANDWQIVCKDSVGKPYSYRFDETNFVNGHLSTTLYNEDNINDIYIIQYELDMQHANRLYGKTETNHGVTISICWDRIQSN